jgi:hypothetical protein
MRNITPSELEALQLLVQSGRIPPNVNWTEQIEAVRNYIFQLAARLQADRMEKQKEGD